MPQTPAVHQVTDRTSPDFGHFVVADRSDPNYGLVADPEYIKRALTPTPTAQDINSRVEQLAAATAPPTAGSIMGSLWDHTSRLVMPAVHTVLGTPGAMKDMYQVAKDTVTGNNSPEAMAFGRSVIAPTQAEMVAKGAKATAQSHDPNLNLAERLLARTAGAIYNVGSLPFVNPIVSTVDSAVRQTIAGAQAGDVAQIESGIGDAGSLFAAAKTGALVEGTGTVLRRGLNKAVLWPGDTLNKFPNAPKVMAEGRVVPANSEGMLGSRPLSWLGVDKTMADMLGVKTVDTASRALTEETQARTSISAGTINIDDVLMAGEAEARRAHRTAAPSSQGTAYSNEIAAALKDARDSYDNYTNNSPTLTAAQALESKLAEQSHAKYNTDPTAKPSTVKAAFSRGAAAEIRRQLIQIDPTLEGIFMKQQGMLGAAKSLAKGDKGVMGPIRVAEVGAVASGIASHIPAWWAAGLGAAGLTSPSFSTVLQTALRQGERITASPPGVYAAGLSAGRTTAPPSSLSDKDAAAQIKAIRDAIKGVKF